jgi:hypothetical protein
MRTAIFMFVVIAALGAAAITAAISYVEEIDAKSCDNDDIRERPCHGCSTGGQGFESSKSKCYHREDDDDDDDDD